MATLRDIRNRIKGVQSTQKITKAMKMVAAAKLRRAQDNIINARPYAKKISGILSNLVTEEQRAGNTFLLQRPVKNVLYVVITSDRGLCGTFNTNIIKEAQRNIEADKQSGLTVQLFCIGKKGTEYFTKRKYSLIGSKIGIFHKLTFDSALSVANTIISGYQSEEYDLVKIVYNEFRSVVSQKVVCAQYLPVPLENSTGKTELADTNYIYEKDQASIFEYTLPKHLRAHMWKVLLESNASEFGAQMTAMDNATTNAGELIKSLNIKYNKERQASITTEILEIVSGANALKESKK
ncbi:MAG: ATP synthase F1 subunit gamma [Ignavibacteria bacterium]|nr:ATP synthase F1 subunit gamma [Ignavibacteria bacterium]